jgi:hypothetical protein
MMPTTHFDREQKRTENVPPTQSREETLCVYEANVAAHSNLEEHINYLLKFIYNNKESINYLSEFCDFDIFIGIFSYSLQTGFTINSKIVENLSIFNIDLVFDIYTDSDNQIFLIS